MTVTVFGTEKLKASPAHISRSVHQKSTTQPQEKNYSNLEII